MFVAENSDRMVRCLFSVQEEADDLSFDVISPRRLDQEVGQFAIAGIKEPTAIDAVVVENPSSQKKSSSLVPLNESLCSRNAIGKDGRRLQRSVNALN